MSFSKRLKQLIEDKGLSQAEAARLCGIAQQSMNYILKNDLKSSKIAPQIADALNINPEWLIYGEGRPDVIVTNEIPIIHSPYMLKKYMADSLAQESLELTIIDKFLGNKAFAYLVKPTKMAICADSVGEIQPKEYLTLKNNEVIVATNRTKVSFPIFEWRERYEDF